MNLDLLRRRTTKRESAPDLPYATSCLVAPFSPADPPHRSKETAKKVREGGKRGKLVENDGVVSDFQGSGRRGWSS